MANFSAYDIIQARYEQTNPLKWSLNYFCGNEYVKYVVHGKVDMKLSVEARVKN